MQTDKEHGYQAAVTSFREVPESDWIISNDLAFAIRDRFPVTDGHTLVITRRVVASWFDATPAERAALLDLVDQVAADWTRRTDPTATTWA